LWTGRRMIKTAQWEVILTRNLKCNRPRSLHPILVAAREGQAIKKDIMTSFYIICHIVWIICSINMLQGGKYCENSSPCGVPQQQKTWYIKTRKISRMLLDNFSLFFLLFIFVSMAIKKMLQKSVREKKLYPLW